MGIATLNSSIWVFSWVFCSMWHDVMLERIVVDMTGQGCFDTGERTIRDDQEYAVTAKYNPNLQPTMDHCDISLRAVENNRRLEYLVNRLTIFDCGITIWLYDNPQLVSNPTRIIECNDNTKLPLQGKTSHGVLKISLRKESSQATAFDFQILVKTDYGPPFDFEKDAAEFYEQPLDTGAIVGIVIAGSVLVIAVAGLAIYCCLKARMNNSRKYAEASDDKSAPPSSVYTTGSSRVAYQPGTGKQRSSQNGGGFSRPPSSQDSDGRSPSKHKGDDYNTHAPYRDGNGRTPYKDSSIHSNKNHHDRVVANQAYENENEKFDRQASLRGSQKRRQYDASFDDADYANVKGGHLSRRDSGRGSQRRRQQDASYDDADMKGGHLSRQGSSRGSGKRRQNDASFDDADHKEGHVSRRDSSRGSRVKYNKKTHYSRNDDYGSVGRTKKQPGNGHRRARSRSPSQGSLGSTVDSNALVYGYSRSSAAHPNTVEDRDPRSRSRSGSRSRARAPSQRSGSISRSRTGSVGRSDARPRTDGRDTQRTAPKNARQYGDMSDFLPEQDRHRSRSRSAGSMGRSHRR